MFAKDHLLRTRLDNYIGYWLDTLQSMENGHRSQVQKSYYSTKTGYIDLAALNHDTMAAIGEDFVRTVKEGNSQFFREWADAVETWHKHVPRPDKMRLAIISICIPPNSKFSVRNIIAQLPNHGVKVTDETPRIVRRICHDLNIRTDGKSGRPSKYGQK